MNVCFHGNFRGTEERVLLPRSYREKGRRPRAWRMCALLPHLEAIMLQVSSVNTRGREKANRANSMGLNL
jgi:hypothetical protein